MALKLWLGNAGSGKSYSLYEEVIREAQQHKDLNYLVIVPEQFTLQTQRDLVMMHPDGGILNIDVLSFNRLSYRVFEEIGFAKAPGLLIDDMGKNLILRHLATEQEGNLKVIGRNLKKLGYITEVKSIISEFMQYGVKEPQIAEMIELCRQNNRRLLSDKLEDIATIYKAFRTYIEEKYTTNEELLIRVSTALQDSEKLSRSVIVLDGFTGFTPVQYDLIRALMQKCVDVHVTVLIDTHADINAPYDEQALFFLSQKTIKELKHIAEESKVPILEDHMIQDEIPYRFRLQTANKHTEAAVPTASPAMLIHLEKNLFRENAAPFEPAVDKPQTAEAAADQPETQQNSAKITDDIQILTARNPLDEMSFVAAKIEELIRTKHYRYKDIAIVTGDPDTYMHAADRVLTRFHIPFFVDRNRPVLQNPFIEYLRAIMRILTENYSHDGMFAYLKSSMPDIQTEDVDLLENYCLACGIRGKKRWNTRFTRCPDFMSEEDLQHLEEVRKQVIAPFAAFDDVKTVRDYATALYRMLVSCDAQQKMNEREAVFKSLGEDVKTKEYDQIYGSVITLLEKLVELLGEEEIGADEFYELLDAGFGELRVGVIPSKTDYVQIGDLTRSRFPKIKALFFVGVNEGIIPQNTSSGGILSDLDREFFKNSSLNIELAPSVRMQAYTQRLYLYIAMTKPTEQLYLSYAGVSDSGTSMQPSYLIGELENMFPNIRKESYEQLSALEKVYTDETAFTELTASMQGLITSKSTPEAEELLKYFIQNEQFKNRLESMINSAFQSSAGRLTDSVGAEIAHVIYGKEIKGSVTRLEMYAKCAYEHFLHYGLDLKEREEFSFEASDMGSVFHTALEAFAKLLQESNLSWTDLSDADADRLCEQAVQQTVVSYDAVYATFRSTYMVERISRILKKTVKVLRAQIKAGDFVPKYFELGFSEADNLSALQFELSAEEKMQFRGRIDRVDLFEDADHVYVKIIDYKSGAQKFDLAAIYRGEQLQLVVYMNAALELEERRHPQKEVLPAGILYYHLDDPLIDADPTESDESINDRIFRELKMQGLVNADQEIYTKMDRDLSGTSAIIPVSLNKDGSAGAKSSIATNEEFRVISDYVNRVIIQMGQEMMDGKITPSPGHCAYCSFAGLCGMSNIKGEIEDPGSRDEIMAKMRARIQA